MRTPFALLPMLCTTVSVVALTGCSVLVPIVQSRVDRSPTPTPSAPTSSPTTRTLPSAREVVENAGGYLTRSLSAQILITRSGNKKPETHRIVGDLAGTKTRRVVTYENGGKSVMLTIGPTTYTRWDEAYWRAEGGKAADAAGMSKLYLVRAVDKETPNTLAQEVDWAFGAGPVAESLRGGRVELVPRYGTGDLVRVTAEGAATHELLVADDGTFSPVSLVASGGTEYEETWGFEDVNLTPEVLDGIVVPPKSVQVPSTAKPKATPRPRDTGV